MADPIEDLTLSTLALGRGVRRLHSATSDLTDALRDVDARLTALEGSQRELSAGVTAQAARADALLASPVHRAVTQAAVDAVEGRAGVAGRLRAAAAWTVAHPGEAARLAGWLGAAAVAGVSVLRVVSAYVPGLLPVAQALEAGMSAVAPIPSTGGAP